MNARIDNHASLLTRAVTGLLATLLVAALLSIQALIGGTRILFALPAYGLLAVIGIIAVALIRRPKPSPDQICLWSTVVFFGYLLGRAFLSPVPYLARFDIYPILAGLVVYFLISCVLTDARTRLSILACLLAAALVHVLVGAIQFRHGDNFMLIGFLQRFDYGRRASGFYVCPNHLAGLLEVLGVFGLSITIWSRWPVWSKLLIGYAAAICYVGVVLTGSRGGYLSVLASLLIFVVLSARILSAAGSTLQRRIGIAGFILALVGFIAIFSLIHQSDYLTDRTKKVADNKDIRLDYWQAALDQWKLSPLFGTGSRTYLFYGRKFRTDQVQADPVYVHNDYLQLLCEYGIVGVAAFLPFLLLHLRRGWMTARRLGPRRIAASRRLRSNVMALNVGALGAMGAYAVHSFFDFNLHIPANVLLMAFVFGILAQSGAEHGAFGTPPRGILIWRSLLLILAVVLGVQTWRLAPGEYYAEKARTAVRDNRPLAGIASALKGLAFDNENPDLYFYLGRSRVLEGDRQQNEVARASFYRAALAAFAKARELAPLDETYSLELAFTLDDLKRFTEAEWMYGEARAFDPKSEPARSYYQTHLERWRSDGAPPKADQPDGPPPAP